MMQQRPEYTGRRNLVEVEEGATLLRPKFSNGQEKSLVLRFHLLRILLTAWVFLALAHGPGLTAEPPTRSGVEPRRYLVKLQQLLPDLPRPEIVEMLWAMAHGSGLGPGEGWFHPGQSRYGWDWLAARYDANHDGTITRQEFSGPAELFERLDRNHDGVLTHQDFDWSDRASQLRQGGMAGQWFRLVDTNSNGRISRQEWEAFFARAAAGKDYLTPDDLREALTPPAPPKADKKGSDGPSPLVMLVGLFTGELGSFHEGPALGQVAPDFTLKTQDGKQSLRLAQFRGHKPVVLIFGSFT